MKKCPYCGKEYPDEVLFCTIDQEFLQSYDSTLKPNSSLSVDNLKTRSFFRWIPTAIVLWTFAGLFTFGAILDWWMAGQPARPSSMHIAMIGNSQHFKQWLLRGAIQNFTVAVLLILGWYLIRQRVSGMIALGAISVMAAACIICSRSIYWMTRGANFELWCDMVFELPFLAYVIIYAHRESKKNVA